MLRVKWLQLFLADGCVLEVGSATGEFVKALAAEGYHGFGVEVSDWAAKHARENGADVVTGYVSDWISQRPTVRPDAVAMWHVLEHTPDPGAVLREIAALLGVGGLLVLEQPNFDAAGAKELGIEWPDAQPQEHFYHFGVSSMRALIENNGFDVDQIFPTTRRIYTPSGRWNHRKTAALMAGRTWPSQDLLRVVARVNVQQDGQPAD